MKHNMKLNPQAFEGIKKGKQIWETRLLDEKRSEIKIGDTIVFFELPSLEEKTEVKVEAIVTAKNFEELFKIVKPIEANWPKEFSPKDCAEYMEKFYPKNMQEQYNVVSFKLSLIFG